MCSEYSKYCKLFRKEVFFEYVKFINITIIIFIEPGYYEDGSFGMRVESIMEVKKFNLKVILYVYKCFVFWYYLSCIKN